MNTAMSRKIVSISLLIPTLTLLLLCATGCNKGGDALATKNSSPIWKTEGRANPATQTQPFVDRSEGIERRIHDVGLAMERNELGKVSDILAGLLDDAPEDLEIQALVAHAHWVKGRYERAHEWAGGVLKGLSPYVKANPDDLRARVALSRARMVMGDIIGAEVQLRVAIKKGHRDPIALTAWADLLLKRNNVNSQEELIDTAFVKEARESKPLACASHGQLLIALGRFNQAETLLNMCAEHVQNEKNNHLVKSRIHVVKGLLAIRQGDLQKAMRIFKSALEISEDDIDARHNLALILYRKGQPEEALELLKQGDPYPNPEFFFLKATILEFIGDTASSVDALNIALEHIELWGQDFSTRWKVPFLLGRLLARKGQYGRAQQVLEQSLNLEPDPEGHDEILRYLVWVRQKSSKPRSK